MNKSMPLKSFSFTALFLGVVFYSSFQFAAAQETKTEPRLQSQVAPQIHAAALPELLFEPAQRIALLEQPMAQAVGIGDFNHDGRNDVAVSTGIYSPNYLYIFLQGTDGELLPPELYPADVRPEALAVGDLNGDGRDDVAIASTVDNRVSVYLQTNDGKLADRKQYVTQSSPDAIVVADINQDGRDHVIVSHWNHPSVGLLQQQPDGTLAEMVLYTVPQAGYDDIDVGDVNNDGLPDIVKMNGQGINPDLSILHQTISRTFKSPVSYDLSGDILKSGVAVGDVTGDGKADIAITHYGDSSDQSRYKVSLFAQQQDTSVKMVQSLLANTNVEPIEIADVNGDGRNDIVAAGSIRVLVYLQSGDGALAPYQEYQVPYATHLKPQALDVGDINNDGKPDIVIANYNDGLVILYHTVPATPTPVPTTPIGTTPTTVATPNATSTENASDTPQVTTTPIATPLPETPAKTPSSGNVYLPLITVVRPTANAVPAAPVAFSATTLCENEAASWSDSPVTYPYGKRILATAFTVVNQIGKNWRLEWSQDGQSRPALDQSGIVLQSPETQVVEIFYGATGACQLPLPRGSYEVKIYLENTLWKAGKATIQ